MQPAAGAQQITDLVDPASAQQTTPPAAFKAVNTSHEVLPTALMQLLSKGRTHGVVQPAGKHASAIRS